MTVPVTPCGPAATVAFVERRFGSELAKLLDPESRLATVRERGITQRRRCGELRHAERYGWLGLAAWLLGMSAATVGRLDPASEAFMYRARPGDVLGETLDHDQAPALVPLQDTGIEVSDPRDTLGYHVLELAAAGVREGVVELGGRRVGSGAVVAALRARLQAACHG